MTGGGSKRHCAQCDKHLVNLSLLTEKAAHAFVQSQSAEGSFCAMFEYKGDAILFKPEPIQRTLKTSIATAVLGLPLLVGCPDESPPSVAKAIEVSSSLDSEPTPRQSSGAAARPVLSVATDSRTDPNPECDEQKLQQIEDQAALVSYQESRLFYIYQEHSFEGNLSKLDAIQLARNKRNRPLGGVMRHSPIISGGNDR